MTVGSQKDIDALKEIGRIAALTLNEMKRQARVGMATKELDELGGRILQSHGAVSAPKKTYQFPGHTCISVNHEVAHGIPGDRKLMPGDLINIDVCAEKDGYVADTGHSFQLPPYDEALIRLCDYTHQTMMKVISSLKAGVKINQIGRIIQAEARNGGYKVIGDLCSHGVGKAVHEWPQIVPVYNKRDNRTLKEGLVITIEPFLTTGAEHVVPHRDGWTLSTPDRSFAAQHEHTIIITKNKPIILTVA
ncbi:type I methionyl aminopeptidase [Paenibacillus alkaliterrae]|uniref:type I methionyl aminopeptidase n=1 Tax=Paenibacillus alkaliterrae TaxID=320909 RepID=UPI001F3D6C7B|nr:type I methionyl aminopeptidase [Paenibacillus alkaliterrae]MCF2939404.1 type I methionyl aminopeptidase [Paenibacillus alkaliterrae]